MDDWTQLTEYGSECAITTNTTVSCQVEALIKTTPTAAPVAPFTLTQLFKSRHTIKVTTNCYC